MGGRDGNSKKVDLYGVLGVNKECPASELRDAYKKLALRWHPDRCSATGNSKMVEESKKKFQAIQHAYSVLSDANKRFMYDIGAYDSDDDEDDQNGMGDFLNEMATMMSQTKNCDDGDESLEELQDLFDEMFQGDIEAFSPHPYQSPDQGMCSSFSSSSSSSFSSYRSYRAGTSSNNKRSSSEMSRGTSTAHGSSSLHGHYQSFCFGTDGVEEMSHQQRKGSRKKNGRNQRP
ncbi:hypothetical protein MLD38_031072 [Melastoma candidum]|uniref:Uncharacterized protein n=1 Tax=Melastoma candidum TaxID=119954 RepID=A0ACB9MS26_9MYRT|nr:hypothetical protein MLD38_031072 [Melastoma candidum]